jgi:signal transduction histidine kinase
VTRLRAGKAGLALVLALLATALLLSRPDGLLVSSVAALMMALAAAVVSRELVDRRRAQSELVASERALEQEAQRLAAVITTQQLVATASTDVSGIMRLITERVQALTRAAGAAISMRQHDALVLCAGSGHLAGQIGLSMPLTSGLAGQSFVSGEVLKCDDAETDLRVNREIARRLRVRSLVAVPLWDAGAVTGVLVTTGTDPFAFTDRDVQTVQLVAGLLSAGLSLAAAFEARESALVALQASELRASFTDISGRDELERRVRERTAELALLNHTLEAELSERDRSEEERRRAHDELEMRVNERTADLIFVNRRLLETRDAAELANVTKSRFLATMSHELRTPLNSVIGFASILLKNRQQGLSAQDITYLLRIQENGRHLLGLINDILDLSKIEAGRVALSREPVDLAALVEETLAQLGGHLLSPSVRLVSEVADGLRPIEADVTRLKQVLMNLVGNAIKFTDRGSVTVRVSGEPATGRPLEIAVCDTGVGIPADRLEVIFEAFQQGDDTTERRYGGTGLGLTISRSLLQVMGYRLTVESEVGVGSTFAIHLDHAATAEPSGWVRSAGVVFRKRPR